MTETNATPQIVEETIQAEWAKLARSEEKGAEEIKLSWRRARLEDDYNRRIRELERERNEQIHALNDATRPKLDSLKAQIERHDEYRRQCDRIRHLLAIDTKLQAGELTTAITRADIHVHGGYFEDLGELAGGRAYQIRLAIIKTRKPKNKYSLVAVGATAFRPLISDHRLCDYGVDVDGQKINIRRELKCLPSAEEIRDYAERNRARLCADVIEIHQALTAELDEAVATYSLADFAPLEEMAEVPEAEAPLVLRLRYDEEHPWRDVRLHDRLYWQSVDEPERAGPRHIRVDGTPHEVWGHRDALFITSSSNMLFGQWLSLHIEPHHANKFNRPFTPAHLASAIAEAEARIAERSNPDQIRFRYPEVEFIRPELVEHALAEEFEARP